MDRKITESALPPAGAMVALPVRYGIFERFSFPATDAAELEAMVRLQFEKILPYPVEETEIALQILSQTESETQVMGCAIRVAAVESFCASLPEQSCPRRVTFQAIDIAALAPADTTVCGIWREEPDFIFGIFENSRLAYVEVLGQETDLEYEMPRAILRAEAAGISTRFAEVLTDDEPLRDVLTTLFQVPVYLIPPQPLPGNESFDITPRQWRERETARERLKKLRRQLALAAVLYASALIASLASIAWKNRQLDGLSKQTAALQPRVDALIDRQSHWKALAPAVDPQQYLVELLFQAFQSLPSPETRITRFELTQDQMAVEGEAPDAQKAIAFTEKLKSQPGLGDFRFEAGPPLLQPNEHAQFRIFGKR